MSVFFDFDGTLIDSRLRLYKLFNQLIPQSRLSFEEYWALKRDKIDHRTILKEHFEIHDSREFMQEWMHLIETKEFLDLDVPFKGAKEILTSLKSKALLYLVTARQSQLNVQYQLEKFGWQNLFSGVLVTKQKIDKAQLIEPFLVDRENSWMIGDTGKDIQVGKSLGVRTVAVETGFLSRKRLLEYSPDFILPSVLSFNLNLKQN